MSQPPLPPLHLLHPPSSANSPKDMTETQKLPVFSPPPYHHSYTDPREIRRLPQPIQLAPLEIPPHPVPPRPEYAFRSPVHPQLPSIHPGPPPPHHQHQHQHQHSQHSQHPQHSQHHPRLPPSLPRAAPVEKLLHPNPYTPPRTSDPPYSPRQYGPPVSPRTGFESRGPKRLNEQRYSYEDSRPGRSHHDSYASLTSPVEPSQPKSVGRLPSPGYTPSYASSSTPFRGSVGSHSQSHRGSIHAPLAPLAYPEPQIAAAPPRQEQRVFPLPGSIPQPVANEAL